MNLDLDPWIARITAQVSPEHNLRQVGGGIELASVDEFLRATPSVFVLPFGEQAEPNRFDAVNRQRITETISIITAVSNQRDGAALNSDLRTIRAAIKAALVLWKPSTADDPVEFAGGEIWRYNDMTLWWHDRYTTRFHQSVTAAA